MPGLNTTSTADISFMLLVFFLLTSSMDADKGLPRQLPPLPDESPVEEVVMKERNVLRLRLDESDRLSVNGEPTPVDSLRRRVAEFVENAGNRPDLPEKSRRELHLIGPQMVSDRHVIAVSADRHTSYRAYFQMQNAIARAYIDVRNRQAMRSFGHPYSRCTQDERDVLALFYPQRISEEPPTGQSSPSAQDDPTQSGQQKGGRR